LRVFLAAPYAREPVWSAKLCLDEFERMMREDLAINLLAALIAFVAGRTLRALYKYVRDVRPTVRMWRAGDRGDFSIAVADGPLSEQKRPTIHPAKFAAATELSGYLAQSLRINVTRVRASVNFPLDEALEGNLSLIGGPIHKRVHRLMLERLDLPYEFRDRSLIRVADGKAFASISSADGVAKVDYGLIVITANPYNPSARLVLLPDLRLPRGGSRHHRSRHQRVQPACPKR
jgi:hypothetical protein